MLKEILIHRMILFTIKGARLKVCSRKEARGEEVSSGIETHEACSSVASP
jgi:hypothetical protein